MYTQGDYLKKNPTWHIEDSAWKAKKVIQIMKRNNISPKTICEVGCGAGEILVQLQYNMRKDCMFRGYEISPQAFEFCKTRANERLNFTIGDIIQKQECFFDLILLMDLIEHMENYFEFLRQLKTKGQYKILHIPLDLSVQSVFRRSKLLQHRELVGHIHYFTKELALNMLKNVGYEVLDYFYTTGSVELPSKTLKSYIAKVPRKFFFSIHEDITVRILGGYSLMVLAM
jgi:cyclopropane fatty-acyl-phospholipid synthase-like methyltransferase